MTLPQDHLEYPHRAYGMDHERYEWSILKRRVPVRWPHEARVALWIVPALEWFPLNMTGQPFRAPGGLDRPYPDYWNYTLRDYGNRVGYFRVAEVLSDFSLKASVALNSALASRHPVLVDDINRRGFEVLAHGVDMSKLHHGGLDESTEIELVHEAVTTLREVSGQRVSGWLSPAKSESKHTLDIVAKHDIEYVCDWVNDDLPYTLQAQSKSLISLPHPYETDDHLLLVESRHSEDQYLQQIRDQFDTLYAEASPKGGRVFALSLHPWVIGQPFRIKTLERALSYMMAHTGVWPATGAEIVAAFKRR